MLPSCVLEHGNLALSGQSEVRYSFTQYTAGALFRWVDWGFRTMKEVQASSDPADRAFVAEMKAREQAAWREAYSKWPTLDDYRAMAEPSDGE